VLTRHERGDDEPGRELVRYAQRFVGHKRRDTREAANRLLFAREADDSAAFGSSRLSQGLVDDRAIRLQELPKEFFALS